MILTMTLVERRETVYKGKPQVKLTLVDSSMADAYMVAAPNLKTFPL